MKTTVNDLAAQRAAQEGVLLGTFDGQVTAVAIYGGRLRVWVYLARDGRLVVAKRWRIYNTVSGGLNPSEPAIVRFATEAEILELLAEQDIRLLRLTFYPPDGMSGRLRTIFQMGPAAWTDRDRRRILQFFFGQR